ncbi:hypothetical protein SSP24_41790 [Streptomyces spinoverrucosus]|uniref:DUF3995 domain-containing protein n=1 Tax=Streptomyces spinoverrucosus TaxID=284043 RepID=A0A4Y3VHX5_9ACTN|nr:DUF3995 domain-containing protein [Streptomyces spinoverrucosus]GEC06524.1 hypothetical protein SSP24_41790 [Streptomyces spinoverrucosus]GHB54573.1 hypothetical protein GCM10010397_26060 [Streptomyces spinoverrucosus]
MGLHNGGCELRFSSSRCFGCLAAGWAVAFAGLHFFWALGGDVGLDVSSGERLASERPAWFVAGGLWGVGLLCLVGAAVALGLQRRGVHGRRWRALRWLGVAICVLLLARGLFVEVLLIAGVSTVDGISAAQKFWTLALWNPWFILGGLLFGLAARSFSKGMAVGRQREP